MDLSVIIVSYNVKDCLEDCLLSVDESLRGMSAEVVVVDNASADGTCDMISEKFPGVRLIENKVNQGFAAASNKGLRMTAGRFRLLLNPDTIINPDSIRRCMKLMDSNSDAGAAGVRMVDGEGRYLRESKRAFPSAASSFFKTTGLSALFPGFRGFNGYYHPDADTDEPVKVEVLAGAFMFLRSEVLVSAGYLDEDYFMYGEDIDFCYRIMKAGFSTYYIPSASIVHFKGKSTPRNGYDDIRNFYRAMRLYIRKRQTDGEFRFNGDALVAAVHMRETVALAWRFMQLLFKQLQLLFVKQVQK